VTALTRRAAIAGGLCTFTLAAARSNPDWPDRPISMVHGFPAGGPTDLVARIIADGLTRRLGQRVVVEGKPGASGTSAAAQVARFPTATRCSRFHRGILSRPRLSRRCHTGPSTISP